MTFVLPIPEMATFQVALIIFVLTYVAIIFTGLPFIKVDRPSAAFFGAVAMVVFGVLTFHDAVNAIDFDTIALLLGMMIIAAVLELDGFVTLLAAKTVRYSKTPKQLLLTIIIMTGVVTAFIVNDVVLLLFTPVIIKVARLGKLNPIPYLLAIALASNIGSVMTITGNPQNMLIAIKSGISFGSFLAYLSIITLISLGILYFVLAFSYRKDLVNKKLNINVNNFTYDYSSMKWSVPIFILTIVAFFSANKLGLSLPVIALSGAALILIFGKVRPSKVIREVDWVLLLLFAGLFIVVHGIEKASALTAISSQIPLTPDLQGIVLIHGVGFVFSQIFSNVPLTILLAPIVATFESNLLWLSMASGLTLAGNATLLGAIANLIVAETAEKQGVHINFWEFIKVGLIVTILTL
ncbi:MAG: SLC13 family permease, partial [Nanoarchaeota archaeon]